MASYAPMQALVLFAVGKTGALSSELGNQLRWLPSETASRWRLLVTWRGATSVMLAVRVKHLSPAIPISVLATINQ